MQLKKISARQLRRYNKEYCWMTDNFILDPSYQEVIVNKTPTGVHVFLWKDVTSGEQKGAIFLGDRVIPAFLIGLGIEIAEGVATGVATNGLKQLLFPAQNPPDIRALLQEAIKQIIADVKAAISDAALQQASQTFDAAIGGLTENARQYFNNQDHTYLVNTIFMAINVINDFKSFKTDPRRGVVAVPSFCLGGSILLALCREAYLSTQKPGDRQNITDRAGDLYDAVPLFQNALQVVNQNRFSPVQVGPVGGSIVIVMAYFYLDGNPIFPLSAPFDNPQGILGNDEGVMRQYRDRLIKHEYDRLEAEILAPLYAVAEKWKFTADGNVG
jgi:hypothetical protein